MPLPSFAKAAVRCLLGPVLLCAPVPSRAAPEAARIHVSPSGNDDGAGTAAAPFRTVRRAQRAAREAAKSATGGVIVELAAGTYRLDRPLTLTEADSGTTYRSGGGIGAARLLGSVPLRGWEPHRDGIWKIGVPAKMVFHTLYENGRRARKARFPNREHLADFPTARGRYLVTEDGTPKPGKGEPPPKGPGWLRIPAEEMPPALSGPKAGIMIFTGGRCDWVRTFYRIKSIDPAERKLVFVAGVLPHGVGTGARFFLEDDLALLDEAGEFHLDEQASVLYYKPMGDGHPDTLGIAAPVLSRLIEIKGASRDACVSGLHIEGLTLGETDGRSQGSWGIQGDGLRDDALIWMNNATGTEIRECHLTNGGRNGIMVAGHNVGNRVVGCWIENMAVNGVALINRSHNRETVPLILDRCERNVVENCLISNTGTVHTYAGAVILFNVSHNEISHCEIRNAVRYGVTLRGNTGAQYGPPVTRDNQPPCSGNYMHHLRISRCGQDGGDMGALHCANLNNPDGGFVNTFEQITVADSAAIPGMNDIAPDGIFLDWPRMSMDQIFTNVHIVRSQGRQLRSNGRENANSTQTTNVSWEPDFDPGKMDYANIGLTALFPAEYGGGGRVLSPPPPPRNLAVLPQAFHTVRLAWQPPDFPFQNTPWYTVYRDGKRIAFVSEPCHTDSGLAEHTGYRYRIAAQDGDFCRPGPQTPACEIRTLPDKTRPTVESAWVAGNGGQVRVRFSKPVAPRSALEKANYSFRPDCRIGSVRLVAPVCVALDVDGLGADCRLTITGVTDTTVSRNALAGAEGLHVAPKGTGVRYTMDLTADGHLLDGLGSGGDARLCGGALVEQGAGPFGGPALVLDGKDDYAEASSEFNLGPGDFTIMLWMMKTGNGNTILSKGNGFDSSTQWAFGWPRGHGTVSLRQNNAFHPTGEGQIQPGKWAHLAFVRRGNQGFTYVNGAPSGGPHDLSAVGDLTNDEPLRIGRRKHEPNPDYFAGRVADIRLFDHALTDDDTQAAAKRAD